MSKNILTRLDDLEKAIHSHEDINKVMAILAAIREATLNGTPDEYGKIVVSIPE